MNITIAYASKTTCKKFERIFLYSCITIAASSHPHQTHTPAVEEKKKKRKRRKYTISSDRNPIGRQTAFVATSNSCWCCDMTNTTHPVRLRPYPIPEKRQMMHANTLSFKLPKMKCA